MMMTCVRSRAAPALVWTVLVLAGCLAVGRGGASDRTFTIANDQFLRDGQPFQVRPYATHFWQVPLSLAGAKCFPHAEGRVRRRS